MKNSHSKILLKDMELNEKERAIFKSIQTYLKKNRAFQIKKIIPFLQYNSDRSLNLNSEQIEMILHTLIKKNMIYPGSYLTVDDILKNEKRKEIFDLIKTNPGVNFSEIKNTFGFGNNYADWHLRLLERFQFIRTIKVGNNKVFFNFNLDSEYDEIRFYLRNEKVKQIITLMENNHTVFRGKEISEKLKIHYDTIKKYVGILEKFQVLDSDLDGKTTNYKLNLKNYKTVLDKIGPITLIS